ncbi:uncharacterized protein ACR2FA_004540 [Aphomia sociella]
MRRALRNGRTLLLHNHEFSIRELRALAAARKRYTMGSEQVIANELLAFIQHAIDTMDEVSIMQICKSNFKEEEICNSKVLLYQTLGKGDWIPSRSWDEKGERSLQDIISLLKETDPDDVPAFVAKQLHKLPPVTFDHVDVTRLLKDITTLKAGLVEVQLRLEASESTICDLRAELVSLKSNDSVSGSHEVANINTRRGAKNASIGSIESANSPSAAASSVAPRPVPRSPTSGQLTSRVNTSTPRAYATAAATSVTAGAPVATSTRAAREVPLPQRPSKYRVAIFTVRRCRVECCTAPRSPTLDQLTSSVSTSTPRAYAAAAATPVMQTHLSRLPPEPGEAPLP